MTPAVINKACSWKVAQQEYLKRASRGMRFKRDDL
jgi:hypothetical protein